MNLDATDCVLITMFAGAAAIVACFISPLFGGPDPLGIGWGYLFSGMGFQ